MIGPALIGLTFFGTNTNLDVRIKMDGQALSDLHYYRHRNSNPLLHSPLMPSGALGIASTMPPSSTKTKSGKHPNSRDVPFPVQDQHWPPCIHWSASMKQLLDRTKMKLISPSVFCYHYIIAATQQYSGMSLAMFNWCLSNAGP